MTQPAPEPSARALPIDADMFRRLVEGVRDYGIFILDDRGFVRTWNEGARRIKGYEAAEIIGKHFSTFYTPEAVRNRWPDRELQEAVRQGSFEDNGWRVRRDGTRFWANVIITALRDDAGALIGYSKVTRDLTERREEEERLRHSEERFRLLVENVQDYAIFLLDPSGNVVTWNGGAQRIKGYAASEIVGRHFSVFYPPEALARNWPAEELRRATAVGRLEDEGWRVRKDGTRFWANVVITALRDGNGELRGFSKITRDLTERRAHEERLRESEEGFRLLLEGVEDYAIFMLDEGGLIRSWNAGAQRILGYGAFEVVGQSYERFFQPRDRDSGLADAHLRQALLNRRAEDRGWRVRKDGTSFFAEVLLTPLHDSSGQQRGFAVVIRDLSDRKRMEDLEVQGRHLTEFLAMLAHELRNPLAPIRNALGIIAVNRDLPPQVAWAHAVIERQSAHLTRLVDDLLDVSRITRGKLRLQTGPVDMGDIVTRSIESARPLIDARRHRLHVAPPTEPLAVHGDATRLTQVVSNLLNNAAKYTPEGGDIWIAAARVRHEIIVTVRDNGAGIPPEMLAGVFDLFAQGERTIDRAEGGLGIGLTLARRIVVLHGGSVEARSPGPGLGSEFEVRLPRLRPNAIESAASDRESASPATPPKG